MTRTRISFWLHACLALWFVAPAWQWHSLAHHHGDRARHDAIEACGSGLARFVDSRLGMIDLREVDRDGAGDAVLDDGAERTFIEDGDTLTLGGTADNGQFKVGFGEARGTVLASPAL